MAGDWIKMETTTPDKPEVLAITARMGWDDPDFAVGKLFRVWRWFDQHTTNGNAPGVTSVLLDRIAGVTGFADAMSAVGWLVATDQGITLPGFEKHCGKTAKDRAQTAKRVSEHRSNAKSNGDSNANGNAPIVTSALAREEKRRIKNIGASAPVPKPDNVTERVWTDFQALRKSKGAPVSVTAIQKIEREAAKANICLNTALEECCARGWQGFKAEWWLNGKEHAAAAGDKPARPPWAGAL